MIHGYPYTDFHELNLDYILKLCRETMGLHFDQADKFLKLVNQAGEEVSKIKVYYAETALKDDDGNVISTYIIDAGVDGNNVVFDRGNGEVITLTIPYATKAKTDVNNVDLTSYVHGVGVSGNKLLITFGDGNTYSFTVPFATKAQGDENGKNITTYVAQLSTANDKLVVTDGAGVTLAEITIPYAVKALNDVDGDAIKSTYGTDLTVDTTTVSLRAKDGSVISTITVPYAVKALTDTEGNTLLGDYGYNLTTNGNKVGIEAHNGTTLNEITVPFATLSTDATNAISAVSVSGDELVFTTHGGTSYRITSPYSVKAQKDSLNNTLTHAYIASVTNDPDTGEIEFYAQDGTLIASLTPTLDSAIHDSYNNLIADYVKEIIVNPQNNYVVVNHGTGDSDTLTINYATHAYKDTYENIIGNTYIRSLAIIEDAVDHNEYLVAYNGELSELFRINLNDLSAVTELDDLSDVSITTPADGEVLTYDANANEWVNGTVPTPSEALDDLTDVTLTTPSNGDVLTYDSTAQEWVNQAVPTPVVPSDLDDLSDVAITTPANDQALIYDSANQVWKNQAIPTPTVPTDLDDLSDVSLTSPVDGDVLLFDGNSNEWVNGTVPSGVTTLAGLSDVDVSTVGNGDILRYDATAQEWKADVNAIGDLSGVGFSGTASDGEVLTFDANANEWTNKAIPTPSLAGLSDVDIVLPRIGQTLVYDPDTGKWFNEYAEYSNIQELIQESTRTINANSYYDFTINGPVDILYNNYPVISIDQSPNFNPNLIPMYIRREHSNSIPGLNVPGYIYHFRIYNFTSTNQVIGDDLAICIREYARG